MTRAGLALPLSAPHHAIPRAAGSHGELAMRRRIKSLRRCGWERAAAQLTASSTTTIGASSFMLAPRVCAASGREGAAARRAALHCMPGLLLVRGRRCAEHPPSAACTAMHARMHAARSKQRLAASLHLPPCCGTFQTHRPGFVKAVRWELRVAARPAPLPSGADARARSRLHHQHTSQRTGARAEQVCCAARRW
ncbi:hypothetical protein FA09DRAFT_332248 [Tilletiopsis washingtonensis]|uniref:Uncharacterized protein n=1 Tax=Tilletiopsis washingtonensis TaxID=58919 RepID=A0A316Z310_9BASI|nr:hypothetical protein FA09DRAFT_332248 [Tilletiopsis washingtonensis]PWN95348.1 hypothetical protein FA09DRAFT_332248 [Tilletiopsis washingtonensis]